VAIVKFPLNNYR